MKEIKTIKCAFTVLLLAQVCAPLSAMPPEAAAIFEKAGVTLTDADLYRAAEAYNFWQQKGENVWPGADMRAVPLQLVFPEKLDVIIGHPSPPADCVKENIKLPGLDKTFCHRPDRTFYYGFAAGQENGVPMVSLNTMEVFDEYANALMKKQGLAEGKYAKTYREYQGSLVHELLHAYQYAEKNFLPKKEKNARRPKLTKLDYPYQDEENCLLLGLEGRVLADIMDEKDPGRIAELWRDFMAARAARRATTDTKDQPWLRGSPGWISTAWTACSAATSSTSVARSTSTTFAPSAAADIATPRPIPCAAPVTIIVRPAKRCVVRIMPPRWPRTSRSRNWPARCPARG